MALYFFVVITLIIIGLLVFALSESKGRNSPNARGKKTRYEHIQHEYVHVKHGHYENAEASSPIPETLSANMPANVQMNASELSVAHGTN